MTFSGKVESKALWSRGLFVSYSGFTPDVLHAFARGRRTSIVCMDGLNLMQILSGGLNFVEVIQRKSATPQRPATPSCQCATCSCP